jgi:tetratricopeptide (TPR) repeat protein
MRVEGQELGFVDGVGVDTGEFLELTGAARRAEPSNGRVTNGESRSRALTTEALSGLERAVALYRGDLLEGFYEDWTVAPRESLRLTFLSSLERLFAHHLEAGDYLKAIARGREVVRHDPFRERIHRALMRCHWEMGDRPLAVRQYQACERLLRDELDMEPMQETRELHDRIRRGRSPSAPDAESPREPDRLPGRRIDDAERGGPYPVLPRRSHPARSPVPFD